MGKVLYLILRIVCYLALALILGSIVALTVTNEFGACTQNGDLVECASPLMQGLANGANITLLISAFTIVPILLALGGVVFLIRWGLRKRLSGHAE